MEHKIMQQQTSELTYRLFKKEDVASLPVL